MGFTGTLTIKNTANQTVQVFTAPYMFSANIHLAESMVGDELSYDTATFNVTQVTGDGWGNFITSDQGELYTAGEEFLVLADEMLDAPDYPYGYRAIYEDGTGYYVFYVQKITRTGKYNYQIDCISAVGLLSTMQYDGGLWLYTSPTTVQALLTDILSGSGVSFAFDPTYANQRVSGWLPICTKREAIQQVLFATGLNLIRQHDGTSYVTGLDASTSTQIPDNRVYYGGKVTGKQAVSRVVVVEHDFVEGSETEEIFSGDITDPGTKIVFDKPYHNIVAVDGNGNSVSIDAYANYCIVATAVNGVTITGQLYIDNTTEIEVNLNHDTDKVATVDKAYLVNIMNAEGVANRIAKYYSSAVTVESAIVYHGAELPGDNVTMKNTWDETITGLISQMDIVVSATNKANLKVATDYIPGGAGNLWEHAVVLSSNQTWTVPASNTSGKIKVICIQGGDAGQNGYPGEDGQTQSADEFNVLAQRFGFETVDGYTQATGRIFPAGIGRGGNGGAAGVAGTGGKIAEFTLDVNQGDTLAVTVGAGGVPTPIVSGGETGGVGGESKVVHNGVTYSSASGTRSPSGFVSYMLPGSPAYAKPGLHDGIKGARSGQDYSDLSYEGYMENNSGGGIERVVDYDGHEWVHGRDTSQQGSIYYGASGHNYININPSRGGGSAVGSNGGDADPTDVTVEDYYETDTDIFYDVAYRPGSSGDGATPIQAESGAAYGDGGCGGHGGGGGGGQGYSVFFKSANIGHDGRYGYLTLGQYYEYSLTRTLWTFHTRARVMNESAPGQGGGAGLAGAGAQGCVIIYY